MTSHTRAMYALMLWSSATAMIWLAGTAHAQDLRGEALVKALQKGGYILVMRHASSPPRGVQEKNEHCQATGGTSEILARLAPKIQIADAFGGVETPGETEGCLKSIGIISPPLEIL